MKAIFISIALFLVLPYSVHAAEVPGQRVVRVQKSNLTRDEEIRLGEQAAARTDRKVTVLHNTEVEEWLNKMGTKLSGSPEAGDYTYRFKLVQDDTVNAVSFPGGLVYVNTGLLTSASNESEVAGVLAHEMSHVALRHGAAKETKAKEWKTALQVAGIAAGAAGVPLAGPAINMGGEAGVRTITSKYSRDAERDADLNGARMMAAAGYNPEALAHFLETLGQSGASNQSKHLGHLDADHPDAARRAQLIREDIRFYPAKTYEAESGRFIEMRAALGHLSASKKPATAVGPSDPAHYEPPTAGTK